MIKESGKRIPQIFFGFNAVMENNDRSLLRKFNSLMQTLLTGKIFIEISRKHIPHYDLILIPELFNL
jgi:hypothetical protein